MIARASATARPVSPDQASVTATSASFPAGAPAGWLHEQPSPPCGPVPRRARGARAAPTPRLPRPVRKRTAPGFRSGPVPRRGGRALRRGRCAPAHSSHVPPRRSSGPVLSPDTGCPARLPSRLSASVSRASARSASPPARPLAPPRRAPGPAVRVRRWRWTLLGAMGPASVRVAVPALIEVLFQSREDHSLGVGDAASDGLGAVDLARPCQRTCQREDPGRQCVDCGRPVALLRQCVQFEVERFDAVPAPAAPTSGPPPARPATFRMRHPHRTRPGVRPRPPEPVRGRCGPTLPRLQRLEPALTRAAPPRSRTGPRLRPRRRLPPHRPRSHPARLPSGRPYRLRPVPRSGRRARGHGGPDR